MNHKKKSLILAVTFIIAYNAPVYAGTLTVINKIVDQPIQLFIRGEHSDTYQVVLIQADSKSVIDVKKEYVNGKETYEVIASTSLGGDPDWKLLGGKCSNLVTNTDHIITIDSLAGKVSCRDVTANNPIIYDN